jgi:hypothetical protein
MCEFLSIQLEKGQCGRLSRQPLVGVAVFELRLVGFLQATQVEILGVFF